MFGPDGYNRLQNSRVFVAQKKTHYVKILCIGIFLIALLFCAIVVPIVTTVNRWSPILEAFEHQFTSIYNVVVMMENCVNASGICH